MTMDLVTLALVAFISRRFPKTPSLHLTLSGGLEGDTLLEHGCQKLAPEEKVRSPWCSGSFVESL